MRLLQARTALLPIGLLAQRGPQGVECLLYLRHAFKRRQRDTQHVLEALDALQAGHVRLRVEAVVCPAAPGGRDEPDFLVVAQRALGEAGARGDLLDTVVTERL